MEHCFRTALCIFVLLGCLQAAPTIRKSDFHFNCLKKVTCNRNITFRCPKNESGSIIKQTIEDELKKAQTSCPCKCCARTLETLDLFEVPSVVSNALVCKKGTAGSLTFNQFVDEFEEVVQSINSNPNS